MHLEHANITVSSIEKTKHFLGAVFPEFKVRGQGEAGEGSSHRHWLHFGTDETYIALEELTTQPPSVKSHSYFNLGINHLCFVVDDIDAVNQRLVAAGYKAGGIVPGEPFRKRTYIFDAVGHEWEFVQYLSDDPAKKNQYL
jgi:catechol 2,3-dioxygenase-like lactoylglutathione lyase family enzyme